MREGRRLKDEIAPVEHRHSPPIGHQPHVHIRAQTINIGPETRVNILCFHRAWADFSYKELAANPGVRTRLAGFDIGPGQGRAKDYSVYFNRFVATPDQPIVEGVALIATMQLLIKSAAQTEDGRIGHKNIHTGTRVDRQSRGLLRELPSLHLQTLSSYASCGCCRRWIGPYYRLDQGP